MKICSLLPSGTEILYALGLDEALIGVTDLCDYPPAVRDKPIVCRSRIAVAEMSSAEVDALMGRILAAGESPYVLDTELLAANPPDLVLTQDLCYFCEVDAPTVGRAVAAMPAQPEILILNPRALPDIFDTIYRIGSAAGAGNKANALVAALQKRVDAVAAALPPVSCHPRVFSLEGINPLVVGGHWIPDLLERAGGAVGPFRPGCPASRIDWQEVTDYAPEKLFIDLCSSDLARQRREVSWLAAQPGWPELPAVAAGEVYLIDHAYFSIPGPRIVTGLEILAQLTHPQHFCGRIPLGTVLKLDGEKAAAAGPEEVGRHFRPWPPG